MASFRRRRSQCLLSIESIISLCPCELVYRAGQDFNMSVLGAVIGVQYTRAYVLYGKSNDFKFTKNSGVSVKAQLHYLINNLHVSATVL